MENQTEVQVSAFKQVAATVFEGTVNDFVKAGLKANGEKIDKVTLSMFGKYKLIPQVGEQKPARGRSAAVYRIETTGSIFSF